MKRVLRYVSWSFVGLLMAASGPMACSHDSKDVTDKSEVSVNDEARAVPDTSSRTPASSKTTRAEARIEQATDTAKTKGKKAVKRTEAAADRTAASAPAEGSEEEYAADVDAAMGDVPSTATRGTSDTMTGASVAVNSEADNSRVNRLANGDVGLSADQQGNSKADVEITRKIRRSITSNKDLSTYAHNVKIITREGRVVLKGPVRSENERKIIEDAAVTVAGATNVTSGIEISAK